MKSLFLAFATAALCAISFSATAQTSSYPNRSIKIIVPYAAGGGADQVARMIGQKLSERLKQPVVVENRGGASNTMGMSLVAKSPADGYTLGLVTPTFVMTKSIVKNHPYEPLQDFVAVAMLGEAPLFLAVTANLPVKNLKELIEYGKKHPGELNWASGGTASTQGLAGLLFSSMADIKTVQIQYKGSSQGMNDLLAGAVQFMFNPMPSIAQHAKSGKLKILGVASTEKLPMHPDIPVIGETVPGFHMNGWFGLAAPAGTPKDVVERLNREIGEIVTSPDTRKNMIDSGLEPKVMSASKFGEMIASDYAKYAKIFATEGVKPE
ncbi:tripartite tricarboxylate transporter substrate binding protein [Ramlibacter sp. AW1]|uniref:Tripartite tricarboxylate transporter substrate binding protein n=1 Tax=Ramlibacter aurantiacus TaxID=2801330 RepID=A0A936ZKN6_9BURK|nr:tripartite tricarboxylate transporter substrate binding protein [Ramlibacter aurantiacus]MBL0422637.1 tripartite tricarboxylate transporter substrate binding protein [Ramlibacter aurantiacus]